MLLYKLASHEFVRYKMRRGDLVEVVPKRRAAKNALKRRHCGRAADQPSRRIISIKCAAENNDIRVFSVSRVGELLRRITGAGCMLTSLAGVYCGAAPDRLFEAAVTASEVMKHCGEIAEARVRKEMEGTASFRTRLIDAVSLLSADELTSRIRLI